MDSNNANKDENVKMDKNAKKDDLAKNLSNDVEKIKMNDEAKTEKPSSAGSGSFISSFKAFSKFGDIKSDGKLITLSQSDKWMKQAKVIDGKKVTTTDTGIYFKKQK